jgi:tetratricopeptide (TPR) repeat protein
MGVVERALGGVAATHGNTAPELQKILKNDPNDTRALLRLAELEAKAGNSAIACETYSRAGDIFVRQGFARRALSAFAQALTVAREGALVDRVQPIAHAMGKIYASEKLVRDAVTTLDGAARWLIERGFDTSALPLLEERLVLEDSDVARVRLAETYFRLGEPGKAADQLVTAFRRLQAHGRRDEALDVAERLLGERRDIPIARASAELYLARGRSGDPFLALAKLRICCDADPTHVPTLDLLARAFDLAGHGEKATRVRREIGVLTQKPTAVASRPPPPLPRAHSSAPPPRASAVPPRPTSAVPPRPSAAPPRPSAIRPKAFFPASSAKANDDSIDCAWDDLLVEDDVVPTPDPSRLDPSRASFWPVDDRPAADASGSVVSVNLADVELADGAAPSSSERPASMLETALECIESLSAQGRHQEAAVLVVRHLTIRPHNPLLLERKAEIEEMLNARHEGPPPALFGFKPRKAESERNVEVGARSARATKAS